MSYGPHPSRLVPAPLGRRLGAYAINAAISTAASLVFFLVGGLLVTLGAQLPGDAVVRLGLLLLAFWPVGALAGAAAWVVMESRSASLGKRVMGLRVANLDSGENLTLGPIIGRMLVLGALNGFTFGIGTIIMIVIVTREPNNDGRMWHDQIFGSIVIDERASPISTPAPRPVDRPVAGPPPPAPVPYRPMAAKAPGAVAEPPSRFGPPAPFAPRDPAPQPPAQQPPAQQPRAPQPPVPPPAPVASAAPVPSAAPAAPAAAPAPAAGVASQEADEATQVSLRPGPAPAAPAWTVTLADGARVVVDKPTLLGRDPEPRDGEQGTTAVRVPDGDRLVSKTHLLLRLEGGALWAVDRGSTNGTELVRPGRPPQELVADVSVELHEGDQLSLGGVVVSVRRS
ncbi:Uncharacterized membrane protein YckC, RDD family [Quadrisphaera granulorum]|uniref:Putative RDD family membrane protein YckC n=1 Tax=Quadrisphaera granulorum TaxID=317664 RepID=A0A316A1R6_9ACTN|nr:RDD family protein [Quadrisphaera granulorum]PWJ51168.1 putative RDD family membrane protein YckC [Quadrisphaera granulorum]SZE97818.1 Uncharacterized membrane protein YckC, RDD family [Quadrisphaera granulorum]